MKVAIVGAGLSGLSCAHVLERYGIEPHIYEKKDYLGEVSDLPAVVLKMFNTPVNNPLKFLKKEFDLNIIPNTYIKRIIMHSPKKELVVESNFGFTMNRGIGKRLLLGQISKDAKNPIHSD